MTPFIVGLTLLTLTQSYAPSVQIQTLIPERVYKMQKDQLRDLISRTLKEANLYSESAVELLMLTAAVESNLGYYIRQVKGPARGIFQMEPNTEKDIWKNYLEYKSDIAYKLDSVMSAADEELEWNLGYAILMARVHYLRIPKPLPPAEDIDGLAWYWKQYYNTVKGRGTIPKAVAAYNKYAL